MRICSLSEMAPFSNERVFSYSRVTAIVFVAALLGAAAGAIMLGLRINSTIPYYVAAILLLILLLFRGYVAAHFRSTNWLVRMTQDGLFIKYRSYLNYLLSDDDPSIVFLRYSEIRSVCLVRTRSAVSDMEGRRSTQTLHFAEFELAGDTAALESALKTERARPAPSEKHWYGTSSTLYNDYPVSLASPPFLRVQWSVHPRASVFIESLRPHTVVMEPVTVSEDFTDLESLPRAEQEKRLQTLDARGDTVMAIYLARRLFGTSLADATKMVEDWRLNNAAPT